MGILKACEHIFPSNHPHLDFNCARAGLSMPQPSPGGRGFTARGPRRVLQPRRRRGRPAHRPDAVRQPFGAPGHRRRRAPARGDRPPRPGALRGVRVRGCGGRAVLRPGRDGGRVLGLRAAGGPGGLHWASRHTPYCLELGIFSVSFESSSVNSLGWLIFALKGLSCCEALGEGFSGAEVLFSQEGGLSASSVYLNLYFFASDPPWEVHVREPVRVSPRKSG